MGNIQNVCSGFRNTGQQLCQVARLVCQFGFQLDNASCLLQALCDDARKGRDVHIASGYDNSCLERGIHLVKQKSSNGRSACALGQRLSSFQQGDDRRSDFILTDGHDVVDILLNQAECQITRRQNVNAVCDGRAVLDRRDHAAAERHEHGRHRRRLDADNLDIRAHGLYRRGDTADQSAASDGDDDLFHIRHLLQDLQTDGSLSRNDIRIIEGMRKGIALFSGKALCFPGGIVIDSRNQNHLGAVAPCCFHFQNRSPLRHADDRLDPEAGSGQRDALGMVAGAAGDYTPACFFRSEIADLIVRPADFERSGLLKVLGLNVQIRAESFRRDNRCYFRNPLECFSCFLDHLQGH